MQMVQNPFGRQNIFCKSAKNQWKIFSFRCSLTPGNSEDVVIKIIRVFANMSINPEVGHKGHNFRTSLTINNSVL